MKVKQLMAELSNQNPDADVQIPGLDLEINVVSEPKIMDTFFYTLGWIVSVLSGIAGFAVIVALVTKSIMK